MATPSIAEGVLAQVQRIAEAILGEVSQTFIGNPEITETLLCALIARGHVLLEGVPGIAKTTLVKAFAGTLGCDFRRIQLTPDLLPSDITGTYILDMRANQFVLREGPIFTNVLLADELNRAPPKTQSALLEAMQEQQVTIEGETRPLGAPFFVLATQNPIEQEGTYPLPEAEIDRFLIKIEMGYPSPADEKRMLALASRPRPATTAQVTPDDILEIQRIAEEIHVAADIFDYVVGLVTFTRDSPRTVLGASPRAGLALLRAAKAKALLAGRDYVLPDDVRALAPLCLGHRVILSPEAELGGETARQVVAAALAQVAYKTAQPA
ncbi:MAG TPA: AAA family ATPase [Kofleriaceae bacterium]|nr:AAA family ATPase [Kofleriaceae bacterium]